MTTLFYPDLPGPLQGRYAATIGFFDGVHRGHRYVIDRLKALARERGLGSMVVTFERHPRQVLHPDWQPQLLSSLQEKQALLAQTGIDVLVVLRFDEAMAALSARDFMQQVLGLRLNVGLLLMGYDNRFGHNRIETLADYARYGRELGIEVVSGQPCEQGQWRFSSSLVRRLLQEGDVAAANECLGRAYSLSGTVVHGHEIGRTLGFPTANLRPDDACRLLPASGVYAVRVWLPDATEPCQGMMNIGRRPTFDGDETTLEVHIFGFQGNLYGCLVSVDFVARLRSEQHFDSASELALQMERDARLAKKMLNEAINDH